MTVEETVSLSRRLCEESRFSEAIEAVDSALASGLASPDLFAEKALLDCLTQREVEAVSLLDRCVGAERLDALVKMLAAHFSCRKSMAAKLGIRDTKGIELAAQIEAVGGVVEVDCDVSLAACLIVKNEEKHLERCLESIAGVVDEIVVVDTGSTDRTVEIAERFGAKIGHFEWRDDFAAARNAALAMATTRWALWIDADEELTPESVNPIREGLMRPQFAGYFLRIVNFTADQGTSSQYVHSPLRLFQMLPGVSFTGRIHEQVLPSLAPHGLPTATLENATLLHEGYRPSEMAAKGKIERTLTMLQSEVERHPLEPFHHFNLANAYLVGRDFVSAADAASRCIELLKDDNSYGSVAFQILQTSLIESGRPAESLEAFEACRARGFATLLNEFERAHALSRSGRLEEALQAVDMCLTMEWPEGLAGDYGIVTHKRHMLKGQILAQMGDLAPALEYLDAALQVEPSNAVALYSKGAVLEKQGHLDRALALFEAASSSPTMGIASRRAAVKGLLRAARFAEALPRGESLHQDAPTEEHWTLWASAAEASGDADAACRAYAAAPVQKPDVLVNWGRALATKGEDQEALLKYLEALQIDSENANAYFNCGDLLYRMGRFAEAAEVYQAALRVAPGHASGWFVLGNALAQLDIGEGAQVAYRQALSIDPHHTAAAANLQTVMSSAA